MSKVMTFVEDALRQEGCQFALLLAVNKRIYEGEAIASPCRQMPRGYSMLMKV